MDFLWDLFHRIYDVETIVRVGGLAALTAIVFVETGLLVGFFLPGDSLLVTAGIFAARGDLDIVTMDIVLSVAAVAGDTVGYAIGRRTGPKIFKREDSLLFRRKHLLAAQEFYEKYGGFTIVVARFVPIIRTFAPVVAGVAGMHYRRFIAYNVWGGILWVLTTTLGGYFLGKAFPNIGESIHMVIAVVIFVSLLPAIIKFAMEKWKGAQRAG
ncbi:MAG TPA: VTT domain-containing protein [Candidatus Binatia bacterium]|nr:VTT domain-containing protein [Candidatus Binatia bacterium]